MALDLSQVWQQVQRLAQELQGSAGQHAQRLATALTAFRDGAQPGAALDRVRRKAQASAGLFAWPSAGLPDDPSGRHAPGPVPQDYCVVSTDGSQIDVDRHSPARCYLINLGLVRLHYGAQAQAALTSRPVLYTSPEDMTIKDPAGAQETVIEGPLVGVKRQAQELEALVDLAAEAPPGLPVLALVDGSLVVWTLTGRTYPDYVREQFLRGGVLRALDRAQALARERRLLLAAYVSHPRSADVVNTLRLALCPYEPVADCNRLCGGKASGQRPCDGVSAVLDRDMFAACLAPGERSALFHSQSHIVREYYGPHQVSFFYLNTGDEIARVETPAWLAQDAEGMALLHILLLEQCRKGSGYPVALAEAHERAVVSGSDRDRFWEMVELALDERRIRPRTSAKSASKRTRSL